MMLVFLSYLYVSLSLKFMKLSKQFVSFVLLLILIYAIKMDKIMVNKVKH